MKTDASLSHVSIRQDQIIDIINNTNTNKANGFDGISVSMLKCCASEIIVPLKIFFADCINTGMFPDTWKYANGQPIHEKENRQIKSNYIPISLLPICGKILEKIVFDQVYAFMRFDNISIPFYHFKYI